MGRCYNTAVINAPIETVWETIRSFHDFSWASNVITKLDIVGDVAGDQVGAKRILNDLFHETLQTINETNFSFTYSIDDGPGPVAKDSVKNYLGQVRLLPITENNTTFMEWQSTYNSPNDQAVGDFCNPIYHALLQAIKMKFSR